MHILLALQFPNPNAGNSRFSKQTAALFKTTQKQMCLLLLNLLPTNEFSLNIYFSLKLLEDWQNMHYILIRYDFFTSN